jgi:hypothetical protein
MWVRVQGPGTHQGLFNGDAYAINNEFDVVQEDDGTLRVHHTVRGNPRITTYARGQWHKFTTGQSPAPVHHLRGVTP